MSGVLNPRTLRTEVAKELARQAISPDNRVSAEAVWKSQRDDVKAGYRARADKILSVVEAVAIR
jgi:hypothetical protein